MINKEDFQVYQETNKIYCSALSIPADCIISAYYLVSNKEFIEKVYTNTIEHKFIIKKNAVYTVGIYYKDSIGKTHSLWFGPFTFNQDIIPDNIVQQQTLVIYDKNKINCDARVSNELFYRITRYEIIGEKGQVANEETNELLYSFVVPENGLYEIKIYFEDFDSQPQVLNYKIKAVRRELASSSLDGVSYGGQKSNYHLLFNIIYAFIFREFQRKYDKGYFRYFSVIMGPLVQIGIMVTIFSLMRTKAVLGLSIPLFILTGIVPYNFFASAGNCLTIVQSNRTLLTYKQVKIIDTIFASILMEFLLTCLIFAGGLVLCWYFGVNFTIYNLLSLIASFLLLFFATFGLAMVLSVIGFYFNEFNYAIQIIFRALFYISGVFFSVSNVPVQYQKYFLWNPLFQIIMFIRYSLVSYEIPSVLSYTYVMKVTLASFTLGLMIYFVNRNIFMINDRARV